ncbi:MAG TPA: MotA/TolQ/ExbB proton channel family protein [Burkholderiaceae bacterium]|nr:MotA/TolQ/ExbB proton channel family protein [Burkholderiaceae bacterium]
MTVRQTVASIGATLAVLCAVAIGAVVPAAAYAQASAPEATAAPAADASAPAAAAAPATATPPGASTTATVDNPYGIKAMWETGDYVSKGTLIILVLMSMGSWYILITKLYESIKISGEAREMRQGFFKAASVNEAIKKLKEGSAFRFIAESGVEASEHHEGALTEHIDRNTWISSRVQRAIDDVQSRLQDGLAFLATVGSTAPFVGLFGTVWGILHALTSIGIAGQASIDKVAGPVGEALIMTAIGLAVAVPAVLAYNWLVRRNKVTMESVRSFGADLHGVLMGAKIAR